MNKKQRKWIAGLLCMVLLAASPMSVLNVSAATCQHTKTTAIGSYTIVGYSDSTSGGHTETRRQLVQCDDTTCGEMFYVYRIVANCGHHYYMYDNLGHSGMYEDAVHTYRIYCGCGYNQVVTLICTGINHSVPW